MGGGGSEGGEWTGINFLGGGDDTVDGRNPAPVDR